MQRVCFEAFQPIPMLRNSKFRSSAHLPRRRKVNKIGRSNVADLQIVHCRPFWLDEGKLNRSDIPILRICGFCSLVHLGSVKESRQDWTFQCCESPDCATTGRGIRSSNAEILKNDESSPHEHQA